MESINHAAVHHVPWNKGKLVGQKAPLKQREIGSIRIRLQLQRDARDLALFNLAIDSKLRSCDLVRLRVRDVCQGGRVASRAIVMQRKTQRPVQFEITEQTRESLSSWIRCAERGPDDHLLQPLARVPAPVHSPIRTNRSQVSAGHRA
jgi:integrase